MENLNLDNTGTSKLKEHKLNADCKINMLDICSENCESDENSYNMESDLESEIVKCNEILNPKKIQITLEDSSSVSHTYETDKLNSEIDKTGVFLVSASSSTKNIGNRDKNINNDNEALVEDKLSNDSILFHPSKLQNSVFIVSNKTVDTQILTEEIKMKSKFDTYENNIENELSNMSKKIKLDLEESSPSDIFVGHKTSEYITETVNYKQEKTSKSESNFEESTSLNPLQNKVSVSLEIGGCDEFLNCPLSSQQIDLENNKNCLKNVLSEKISNNHISGENEFVTELISSKTEEFKSEELVTNVGFKTELILGWMKDANSLESDLEIESVSIPKTCERHYSGDTLILDCEESDLDSEIGKCNELLNQSDSGKNVEVRGEINLENTDHTDSSQNLEFLKCDPKTILNEGYVNNLNVKNQNKSTVEYEEIQLKGNNSVLLPATKTDSIVKTQPDCDVINKDIKTETENCNKLPKSIEISEKTAITSNVGSSNVKEYQVTKKKTKSESTSEKNNPDRIFKLAVQSINSYVDENKTCSNICSGNTKTSNQNNNLHSGKKINDHEKEKKSVGNNVVKDYLEDEKDDIINPEWQAIKNLTTNEERYRQVRNCWKSRNVPDPNKNLTYHSYRKRLFGAGCPEVPRDIRQHKRQASSTLSGRSAKRLCTFFLDKEIDSVKKTKDMKKQEIINEMHSKISSVDEQCFQRENSLLGRSHHNIRAYGYSDRHDDHFNNRVAVIEDEYYRIADTCDYSFNSKIGTLNERRNEVLKFYSFYKGLNDSNEDPTLLTESQFQELDEIENIYRQFDYYYEN